MPAADTVVSNTSPLLNLALIDRLGVVRDQFSTITAPEQVWEEVAFCRKPARSKPPLEGAPN